MGRYDRDYAKYLLLPGKLCVLFFFSFVSFIFISFLFSIFVFVLERGDFIALININHTGYSQNVFFIRMISAHSQMYLYFVDSVFFVFLASHLQINIHTL